MSEYSLGPMIVFLILFAGLFIVLNPHINHVKSRLWQGNRTWELFIVFMTSAFVIRLIFAVSINGYAADIGTFKAWASHAFTDGLSNFYREGLFTDYPPGYIYVLYLIGGLQQLFALGHESAAFTFLVKLPAILADLVIGYLIYRMAVKRFHQGAALGLAALYAFNPAIIVNSAAWGQVDSFYMMVILIALSLLVSGKLPLSTAVFALAVLIKPQALMFGPLLLLAVVGQRSWLVFGRCILYGLPVILVLALPFTFNKPGGPLWLYELYFGTLSQYPYISLNAFNLFALLGGNWQPVTNMMMGVSYSIWSTIFIAAGMAYSAYLYFKSKADNSILYYIAFFFMVSMFMLTVKMHERYLFYALLPGIMSFIHTRDRRLLYLFAGFSMTLYANSHYVLINSWMENFHIYRYNPVLMIVSLANTLMFAALIKVGWDIYMPKKATRNMIAGHTVNASPPPDHTAITKLSRRDIILMLGLITVYSVIALFNLGSLRAPETYWQPATAGESFVVDLGKVEQIERINSFAAVGNGILKLQLSQDGKTWAGLYSINRDGGNVFMWQSLMLSEQARYIRVTVNQAGIRLNELAFFAAGQTKPLPIHRIMDEDGTQSSEGSTTLLFDEQEDVAYKKTYLNSMYFDEIYHGRTAYEHTHQLEPFESTHPPLGKIMIAVGTWIFGMNPFGWRVVGTLIGILMIPIMYLFAKRLFYKTEYAFIAAFLLTFDSMHFVQTRISTIDVYGVFFIMLMFYYMYRYYNLNFYRDGLKRTLIPLGLCGLFFGLGVAAKWISLYAGVGLAILFFISLGERFIEFLRARNELQKSKGKKHKISQANAAYLSHQIRVFPKYVMATIGWCILSFILVPLIIYVMSYIPFMQVPGPGHELEHVVSYQKHMYNYHNNLVATHPFSSNWYEWPTMERPLWYYGGAELPAGKTSLIVALGNPAIWGWIGIGSILLTLWLGFKKRDRRVLFIAVALGSVYVPWMLVPRLTFIYHFFAAVPFMILCITYVIMHLREKAAAAEQGRWANGLIYGYLVVVLVLFVMFYPILSGAEVDRDYVDNFLKWKDSWSF